MTDNPIRTSGQAAAFLAVQVSRSQKSFADREAFLAALAAQNAQAVIFELDSDLGETADLVVFSDGTGFFASTDTGSYMPWPFETAYGGQDMDIDELLPPLETPSAIDFATQSGAVLNRAEMCDLAPVEAWARHLAMELPDPPEALRDLIVSPRQDFYWEDRDSQSRAQTLIAQFAQVYAGVECVITIRSHCDDGRPPVQKRNDARMFEQMKKFAGFGSDYEREAMYGAKAYAEITEAENLDYNALTPINGALAWFSIRVLERLGRPVGWDTDYNDQARDRMSGYSANPDSIDLELSDVLSNHERMAASTEIAEFLDEIGETDAFEAVRLDLGLPALIRPGTVS